MRLPSAPCLLEGGAHRSEEFPGRVLLWLADPCPEIGARGGVPLVDPAAGEQLVDARLLGHGMRRKSAGPVAVEVLGDRDGLHLLVRGQTLVERMQERAAVVAIPTPGVLTVENDGHEVIPVTLEASSQRLDRGQEVPGGNLVIRAPAVFEPEGI
jgi:hypothetical protein